MKAKIPDREEERLEALRSYEILDTLSERDLDDLVKIASAICQTPIAVVSLVDRDRQWFKAKAGLDVAETPRDVAFCAHAILDHKTLVVEDATLDPRFSDNPLVTGEFGLRFYAGAPLTVGDGLNIGTLCVIDSKAKKLTPEQVEALEALARQVVHQLESRKANRMLQRQHVEVQEAQGQLQAAQEFLQRVLDHLPIGVFCKDVANDFRFSLCNQKIAEIFGMPQSEVIGKNEYDMLEKHVADAVRENNKEAIRLGKVVDLPAVSFEVPGKGPRFLHTRLVPFTHSDSGEQFVLGMTEDVTDQRVQRALLEHSAKLSSLGEMAGGIAHEINNPLAVIRGNAQLLKAHIEVGNPDVAVVARIADKIDQTTIRISKIIQGLRSFARDGAKDPFQLTSIASIVSDAVELSRARFVNHGVDLRFEAGQLDSISLECRGVQISQIIVNLLNNAYDAAHSGSRDKWVDLACAQIGEHIEVTVTDSGGGIPKELQSKIMQPFFTTKGVGKGTGLGLSISRGIAEAHGGSLTLDTSSQHTRFVLRLPVRQKCMESKAA